jgi:hypothetical protein
LVLPDTDYSPSCSPEFCEVLSVAIAVLGYFLHPEVGDLTLPARKPIPMPEVSIDEHSDLFSGKHNIRLARQTLHMLFETKTQLVQL